MKRQGKGDIMCSSTRLKAREGVEAGGAHAERRAGVTRAAQKRTVRGHGPGTPAQARMRPARHRHCAHQLISSSSGRAAPRPGPRSSTPLSRSPLSRCATPRLVVVAPLCLPSQVGPPFLCLPLSSCCCCCSSALFSLLFSFLPLTPSLPFSILSTISSFTPFCPSW